MRALVPGAAVGLTLALLLPAVPARADLEKEQTEIDSLVAQRKYHSAVAYIRGRPDLMAQPRFLRRATHILVNYSLRALGQYGDPALDADTYNVQARIEQALGDRAAAQKAFARALELKPSHREAFIGLLDLLRSGGQLAEYKRRAAAFAALDYANTWPLGVYAEYVGRTGTTEADREVARELAERQYARDEEVGAVFYNLGRLAEWDGDRDLAHAHFRRSLAALKRLEKAPAGSIEALGELVRRTQP